MNFYNRQYNDSSMGQSLNDLNPRKNRLLSTTGFSNPLNPNTARLPQLGRSSSFSHSTKLKLTTIQATLSTIEQQLHNLKQQTRQSRRFTNFLKDQLGQSQLGLIKLELSTEINKFDKSFKISKKHDQDRSQQIKKDCDALRQGSKKLISMTNLLQSKISKCENFMDTNFERINDNNLCNIQFTNNYNKIKHYIFKPAQMYNLHQFLSMQQQEQSELKRKLKNQQYKAKHQQFKKHAYENVRKKAHSFIQREQSSQNPFVFEDDHFQRWRNHRVFRDIESQDKFKGDKSFKHKPNSDMDKYYDERQRREIKYLAEKKQDLVQSGIIPKEHISRSLASQGPYNPKMSFREIKKDQHYLQPRLRFSNVTDLQRMSQSQMQFDQRLTSIYQKFQEKKLRVGRQESSFQGIPTSHSAVYSSDKKTTKSLFLKNNSFRSEGDNIPKSKTHFKLVKMIQMFDPQAERRQNLGEILKKSQFQRKKDLTNIRSNSYNENYKKRPIL